MAATLLGCGCGGETIEPYGEAIVTVHTDMPVPAIVSALRLDLYDEQGWFESRELATPRAESWPLSFSVVSRHSDRSARTLVRLRAYPSLRVRDYRGERYEPPAVYQEPWVPTSLEQLCTGAERVVTPVTFELRQGAVALTQPIEQGDCNANQHAVTGVHVRIEQAGRYRFEVLGPYPPLGSWLPVNTTLFLRTACMEQQSQVACNDNLGEPQEPSWRLSRLEEQLAPGFYTLFLGSSSSTLEHIDYRIRVSRADEWDEPAATLEERAPPRLMIDRVVRTPSREPEPSLAIDRLLDLQFVHGEVRRYDVVLRGECVGTMARLFESAPGEQVLAAHARTCVSTEGESVPVVSAPIDDGATGAILGTFGLGADCVASPGHDRILCVPSGPLVLGDPSSAGRMRPQRTVPERVARIGRFWIDRHEVTVADYRAALAVAPNLRDPKYPIANNGPMGTTSASLAGDVRHGALCSWSDEPLEAPNNREDYALTCIPWQAARAYCQFRGGDLPTEAQWEHAASSASRRREVTYPWENTEPIPPGCDRAWYGNLGDADSMSSSKLVWGELGASYSGECKNLRRAGEPRFGPAPVQIREREDVTPLGIVGMAGGVSEWILDAAYPYDHLCWLAAPLDDPKCMPSSAPARIVRGGSWAHGQNWLSAASRGFRVEDPVPAAYLGFRCAYSTAPGDER